MSQYRIYILNDQDDVAELLEARFRSDSAALEMAEDARAGQYAAEVWTGVRLVGRLGGEFRIDLGLDGLEARSGRAERLRLAC